MKNSSRIYKRRRFSGAKILVCFVVLATCGVVASANHVGLRMAPHLNAMTQKIIARAAANMSTTNPDVRNRDGSIHHYQHEALAALIEKTSR